jgi:glucose/mannose-6-phosphate isomerase
MSRERAARTSERRLLMVERASLDDPSAVAAADPGGMLRAVSGLGRQLARGFDIGSDGHAVSLDDLTAVVVCGMGGSGIAGDVVRSVLSARLDLPILVSKGQAIPAFCGPRTLLFAVSYSGQTVETLACYRAAVGRRCPVVTVSAGGRLREEALARGGPHLDVPGDVSMPRAALGYLSGALIGWLDGQAGLGLGDEVRAAAAALDSRTAAWSVENPAETNEAKSLAAWLLGRIPVVWGTEGLMEAGALRFKNQINENAKMPAFSSVLPELDHNEIEGWAPGSTEGFAVVALRHDDEHPGVAERFGETIELVTRSGLPLREVRVHGEGPLDRLFGTILLGDLASTYLGILRGVDPTPIPVLSGLKARLGR